MIDGIKEHEKDDSAATCRTANCLLGGGYARSDGGVRFLGRSGSRKLHFLKPA